MEQFDHDLLDMFNEGCNIFFQEETDNILNGVAERNLCSRFAIHLTPLLQARGIHGYIWDPEYNRQQNGQVKTILDHDAHVVNICCDLILHSRGQIVENDNLIAIEMKKANRPNHEKVNDKNRLRALTKDSYDDVWSADGITLPEHVCGYHIGIYMELQTPANRVCRYELYFKGDRIGAWEHAF